MARKTYGSNAVTSSPRNTWSPGSFKLRFAKLAGSSPLSEGQRLTAGGALGEPSDYATLNGSDARGSRPEGIDRVAPLHTLAPREDEERLPIHGLDGEESDE
jgi:hypothetical protein